MLTKAFNKGSLIIFASFFLFISCSPEDENDDDDSSAEQINIPTFNISCSSTNCQSDITGSDFIIFINDSSEEPVAVYYGNGDVTNFNPATTTISKDSGFTDFFTSESKTTVDSGNYNIYVGIDLNDDNDFSDSGEPFAFISDLPISNDNISLTVNSFTDTT